MKKAKSYFIALILMLAAVFSGLANSITSNDPIDPPNEFETLVKYLEDNSIFVSNEVLPIVNADDVKKNLKNPKYQVIDIRSDSWFEYGHIKGAKNLKAAELLDYFENTINPEEFEKIVLVCYSGQSASYFSGLLRIAGYDNVYSMKWGMSSWREDFAERYWQKNIGDDFVAELETIDNAKPDAGISPQLNTGKTEAEEILRARLTELFELPYSDFIVKKADLPENIGEYFIANYTTKENFDIGHIAGAVNYIPGSSLALTSDLLTLPTDKKILVYSDTGLEAAFIVAYLNVLGYDANNLAYGANGLYNTKLKKGTKDAFTNKEINMYPVIE